MIWGRQKNWEHYRMHLNSWWLSFAESGKGGGVLNFLHSYHDSLFMPVLSHFLESRIESFKGQIAILEAVLETQEQLFAWQGKEFYELRVRRKIVETQTEIRRLNLLKKQAEEDLQRIKNTNKLKAVEQ